MCSLWHRLVWTGIQSETAVVTSSIEAEEKASHLLTELSAEEGAFQLHIERMKPVHDNSIMEKGIHVMDMKPVFKDIQSNRPFTYEELGARFNACTVDMTVAYHYINDVLYVTTDTNCTSKEKP